MQQRPQRCGIIAPHAGYAYSGQVSAAAFASVRCCDWIKRAVVIGPAHFVPFWGLAAPSHTAFTTPLGEVPVDLAAVEALCEEALVAINDEPHAPEHALEVELPFLQSVFGDLPVVPLLFGSTSAAAVAAAIAPVWTEDGLLVVSSDLSHFKACSSFTRVTARGIAQPPKATSVARLRPGRLPDQAARQLADLSTINRVEPSSTDGSRPRGALPIGDISSPRSGASASALPNSCPGRYSREERLHAG